jgi:hypothetical protein
MPTVTTTTKTGKPRGGRLAGLLGALGLAILFGSAGISSSAFAQGTTASFSAQIDRQSIGLDDTVSLKLSVVTDGNVSVEPPSFNAPDFDVVNSYDSSFVESYYDSNTGRFGMKNSHQISKILRPSRQGDLRISKIQIRVNGQSKTAADIVVHVGPSGGGTPPPRSYGGGGVGLRGAGKASGNKVMLRAEVDKDHAYKGEQVVVSYYLYRRVRMLNVQVDKFPQLPGFLREELEMPVMQPRMDSEAVVLDGVAYQRSLLARYAAYPLQEGSLSLDSMGIKYTYYSEAGITDDGDDPIMNFFKAMAPKEAAVESPVLKVDVVPIPADGRPPSYSGGVGDFNVISAADKTQVRANEALTLTIKIEGRGNVAAIGAPPIKWPANLEVYDTKASSKAGKGGVGEKIFEILLIPRQPGPLTLPGIDFSFFDPVKKAYVTRSTEPIQVNVNESAPGASAPPSVVAGGASSPSASTPQTPGGEQSAEPHGLRTVNADGDGVLGGLPFWRIIYYLASLAIIVFILIVGRDLFRQLRTRGVQLRAVRARDQERSWDRLRALAREAQTGLSWQQLAGAYETLESVLLDSIDRAYAVGARSLPRSELKNVLIEEKGLPEAHWSPIEKVLEFSETVRFAGAASKSMESRARSELESWVTTAQNAAQTLAQAAANGKK